MKIKFWGARGSIPAPLKPAEVREKLVQAILDLPEMVDPHDETAVRAYVAGLPPLQAGTAGGNTACVEIQAGEEIIAVDAGTGLRELGLELMRGAFGQGKGVLHLFISHPHWDHIQGFTMFVPAFVPGNRIYIYGLHDLRAAFEMQHTFATWPVTLEKMDATITFVPLQLDTPLTLGQVRIETFQGHHPGDSYCYRFTDRHSVFVYASDVEFKQLDPEGVQSYVNFFRDAGALVFDAQYTLRDVWRKVDWGHSSALIGVDLARAAGVKRLILFHHDPTYSDTDLERIRSTAVAYQEQAPAGPTCEILVAYEGLTIDLTPEHAIDFQLLANGETAILTPARVFDELGVDQLARHLAGGSAANPIVDLSQVETLTTGGLKALVMLQQQQGTPIVLTVPSKNVRRIIQLSGYQDCFAVYPSVAAALAAVRAREAAYLPGQIVEGRYQIQQRLGQSALGTTLEAVDTRTGRAVALKVLSPVFSTETVERFLQQAPLITALAHPHIVPVLEWRRTAIATYEVEELLEAPTLEQVFALASGPLPGDEALEIARAVSEALEYAHSRGVIHGDLKPANIFLTPQGVKVGGFGLGRLAEGRSLQDTLLLFMDPAYLAPEQILGQPLDARTDLYALGVVLYRLFTGALPFVGDPQTVLDAHLHQIPFLPSDLNPHISPSLEHLILKLLAKNPSDRYTSSVQALRISGSLVAHTDETLRFPRSWLVGRETPLQMLLDSWEKARQGQGQLVFLTGEPGIGKTVMVQHAATQSGAHLVLMGYAEERTELPAYHLFTQVLQAYLATVPPELFDEEARQLLSDLVRLVPEIQELLPDLPASPALEPVQEQSRWMGSLMRFIQRATRERPWFVILDNLQWADASSLELLRYLAWQLPTLSLLVVGVYRDTDLTPDHPLSHIVGALGREPNCHSLHLERLNEDEVNQLLADIWQRPVPEALSELICHHTDGNPFYVEEVAKELLDKGDIQLQAGEWILPDLQTIALPSSVREVVLHRISFLTPGTQNLLRQAAVLGQTFYFDDLREMSGLSEWEVLEHLDLALERQLILEMPREGQLRFRHATIQQVLYNELGTLRRRMLHRQAGEALERRAGPEAMQRVEELAYHFSQAGEPERFIAYSLPAARQAQAAYANEAAISWYTRTLDMLRLLGVDRSITYQTLEISVHKALAELLAGMGRTEAALEHCRAALALLDEAAPAAVTARQRAELWQQIAALCKARDNDGPPPSEGQVN